MKNSLRSIVFLAVLTLASAPLVQAQSGHGPRPPPQDERGKPGGKRCSRGGMMTPEKQVQRLDRALKLTDGQKFSITAIYESAREQLRALRLDQSAARECRRDKMMEIMKSARAQVRAALAPDQQKKFDQMGARGGRPGTGQAGDDHKPTAEGTAGPN
ncbi:MAG: hypothetical protein PHQ04_01550 [Opitutaceae bacterium]|nr:hypothetical protein [Opitutaceae bacterium]